MGAIKHQGFISDSEQLSSHYGGVPIIYVESEEDRHVFGDCWFRDLLSKVEFKPASSVATSSGCKGVISAVNEQLLAGNAAWGIVDRDIYMTHNIWALLYETNDTVYESAKPFGAAIKVLCLWEMESYLVDVEALEHLQAGFAKNSPRPLNDVYLELLGHCHALVPHAAINAVLHINNETGLSDAYTNRFHSRTEVEADIQAIKFPRLPHSAPIDYAQHVSRVNAFDYPHGTTEERVNGLLRRVHGKAVLERFQSAHNIQKYELDGLLAVRIKEKGRVPSEITKFVAVVAETI
jgi:hypothetical protein